MRIAGSSLLYSRLSIEEACDRLMALEFDRVDIAMQEGWAHVDPSAVVNDVDGAVERVAAACGSAGLDPVALNVDAGDVSLETETERVAAVAEFAHQLGVDVVTLPAASEGSIADDFNRFQALVDVADDAGVTLTVETHWGTHTEDPNVAAEYAEAVPGLGYTLDPGHYIIRGECVDEPWFDLLTPIEHVHVRQAGTGWEEIQQPVEDGHLDIESFVHTLRNREYDGTLTVEYIDSLDGVDPDAAERQATALRDLLSRLV